MSRVCPNYVSSLTFLKTICNYMNYDLLVAPLLTEYYGTTLKKIMPQALWIPFENSANQPLTKIYVKSTLSVRKRHFFLTSFISCDSGITNKLLLLFDICFGNCNHFPIWQETSLPLKKIFFLWESFTPLISQKLKSQIHSFIFGRKKNCSQRPFFAFSPSSTSFLVELFFDKTSEERHCTNGTEWIFTLIWPCLLDG